MNVQRESYFKRKLLRYEFLWNFFYTDKKNVIISHLRLWIFLFIRIFCFNSLSDVRYLNIESNICG